MFFISTVSIYDILYHVWITTNEDDDISYIGIYSYIYNSINNELLCI